MDDSTNNTPDLPAELQSENDTRLGGLPARIGRALLLEPGTNGIVVSIESPWGFGKSDVVTQTQAFFETLEDGLKPVVVNFNPWTIDPTVPFAPALFSRVSAALKSLVADSAGVVDLLGRYIQSAVARREADAAAWWEKAMELGDLPAQSATSELLKELQRSLSELNRPLVILIDDVDRLPPLHMYEMLRLVQSLTYLPRTAILLAFDPIYVKKGLEAQRIEQADEYLDRLVQVRVTLPLASEEEINAMLDAELARLPEEATKAGDESGEERFNDLYFNCLRFLIRSPRDVKRIFDRLRFSERAVRGEVAFADLFALETLAVVAPKVYAHIRSQPEAYIGAAFGEDVAEDAMDEMIQTLAPERDNALASVVDDLKPHVRRLLAALFPCTSAAALRTLPSVLQSQGRIAAALCLQVALRFGLPHDMSTLPVVREFVATPANRKRILRDVLNSGDLARFLSDLRASIEHQDVADPVDFLAVMAVLSASPKAANDMKQRAASRSSRLAKQVWWVLESLFARMEHAERLRHLAALMSNSAAVGLSAEALTFCMRQNGVMDENEKAKAAARWCGAKDLTRLQAAWIKTAAAVFSSSAFAHLSDKKEIFALLSRIDPTQARSQVESLMQLEEDFDSLVFAFGEFRDDPARGLYVTVDEKLLESLGELNVVRDRARQRLYSGPSLTPELAALYTCLESGEPTFLASLPDRVARVVN